MFPAVYFYPAFIGHSVKQNEFKIGLKIMILCPGFFFDTVQMLKISKNFVFGSFGVFRAQFWKKFLSFETKFAQFWKNS